MVSLLISFHVIIPLCAVEVSIDGLTYNLQGTKATVVRVATDNKERIITVPEIIEYEGLTFNVEEIGDYCFSNIRLLHNSYDGIDYWGYDWAVDGKKANGSDSYGSDLPAVLESAFPQIGYYCNGYKDQYYRYYLQNSYVNTIILSESIRTIGIGAFFNTNITTVDLSHTQITQIPDVAFAMSKITNISLPNTIIYINSYAFCNSKLSSINLSENILSIDKFAFASTPLSEIIFPESLSSIGKNAFNNCDLLRQVTYLGLQPKGWVATTMTYIPDNTWGAPTTSINDAKVYPMITWKNTEFTYNGESPSLPWTNNMEGYTVIMDSPQSHSDSGTWSDTIPVTFTKDDEIINVQAVCQYTIKPAELLAKVQDASRAYGDNNPVYEISYSGFVNGENEEVLTTKPTIQSTANSSSQPGDYALTISGGKAKNYTFAYVNGTLTINKAPLTITVNNSSREYGDDNPKFTYVMEGLKNGEQYPTWISSGPQLITDAKKNSSVGIYEINTVNAESPNYEVTTKSGTLTITKAPLMVKVNYASKLYGEVNPNFSYSMQGQKFGEEIEWTKEVLYNTLATNVSEVGEYEVTLSGTIENPNYELVLEPGKLTVLKRPLTLSTPYYTRYYGEENPEFELSYKGFVDGEDFYNLTKRPIVTTTATKFSDVGTYQLSISGGEANNYEFIDKCGTLTIEKAYQSLIWNQEFSDVKKYSQIELNATATSGLDVTYTLIEGKDVANLYSLGKKSYLDVLTPGTIVIMAQQEGTTNYYSSEKLYKTIEVQGKTVTLTMKDGEQGELRENVVSGQSREITILPAKDYKIHSVTYNDMDVTDQLSSDGLFTTSPILEDATLYVIFESTSDAVPYVEDVNPTRISARRGEVVVTNLKAGEQIFVFDIEGREQASVTSHGDSTSIHLKTEYTYIVKAGNKTVKVRL